MRNIKHFSLLMKPPLIYSVCTLILLIRLGINRRTEKCLEDGTTFRFSAQQLLSFFGAHFETKEGAERAEIADHMA